MSHDDIKAALEAASTPWESIPALLDDERRVVRKDGGGDLAQGCSCDYATMSAADAHLIANAPTWLAELLAENERLRDSIQHCADTLALHECERPEIERLTDENDRLRLADDYQPEGVDIVMAKLRDYRRRAEAAEQANQRVRELHHSTPLTGTWGDCANGDCTHEDRCPEETRDVCAHCVDIFGELEWVQIAIPCETIRALDGFLRALDGGEQS